MNNELLYHVTKNGVAKLVAYSGDPDGGFIARRKWVL